jgi:hypothetical protein
MDAIPDKENVNEARLKLNLLKKLLLEFCIIEYY